MKVRALIADDEPVARAGLRDMLAATSWIEVIGEAANGPQAVEQINRLRPDLLFLDIEMPGLLGTDVLRRIEHQPRVIFTTAWAQHAVTAFELGALDYLLKPFGPDRLAQSLERARNSLGAHDDRPLDRLRDTLADGPIERLFIRQGATIVPVPAASVSWFESRGDYVAAHVGPSRHLLSLALARLEARLDPAKFVRIHRTRIVNLDMVERFVNKGRAGMVAKLKGGEELGVSRERARGIKTKAD